MLNDFDLSIVIDPLLIWFQTHARILPWRSNPAPYRVWVSEIMLQQTRVEAVKPYFERFMSELPNIAALAACPDDRLLKLWEGLGYYNRVRNLRAAAQKIESEYGGKMPSDYDTLLTLPGIGHYTAGAISSIAFGKRAAAVDGNVLRVITRLTADNTDIMKQSFRNEMERVLTELMPDGHCGEFNQALMELGATVCVPNGDPKCTECPWQKKCRAHLAGAENSYPIKTKQKKRRIEKKTVLLIRDGNKIVLQKRPETGLLAGLYEFPWENGHISEQDAVRCTEARSFTPLQIEPLPEAKHIFSHVEWHMTGYMIRVAETEQLPDGLLIVDKAETEREYPIPAAYAAYMKAMNIDIGLKRQKHI